MNSKAEKLRKLASKCQLVRAKDARGTRRATVVVFWHSYDSAQFWHGEAKNDTSD